MTVPAGELLGDRVQVVLRQGEEHRDGVELVSTTMPPASVCVDDVALVDQADAGDAVDGRGDARVVEREPRGVDRAWSVATVPLELLDQRLPDRRRSAALVSPCLASSL